MCVLKPIGGWVRATVGFRVTFTANFPFTVEVAA
jgi:hypothetical protein